MDLDENDHEQGTKREREIGDVVEDVERPQRRMRHVFTPTPFLPESEIVINLDDDYEEEKSQREDVTTLSDLNTDVGALIASMLDNYTRVKFSLASKLTKKWSDEVENYAIPFHRFGNIYSMLYRLDAEEYFLPPDITPDHVADFLLQRNRITTTSVVNFFKKYKTEESLVQVYEKVWKKLPEEERNLRLNKLRKVFHFPGPFNQQLKSIPVETIQTAWEARNDPNANHLPDDFIKTLTYRGLVFFGLYDKLEDRTGLLLKGDPIQYGEEAEGKIRPTRDMIKDVHRQCLLKEITLTKEIVEKWEKSSLLDLVNTMTAHLFAACLFFGNLPLWKKIKETIANRFFQADPSDAYSMVHGVVEHILGRSATTRLQRMKLIDTICTPQHMRQFLVVARNDLRSLEKRADKYIEEPFGHRRIVSIKLRDTILDALSRSESFGLTDITKHIFSFPKHHDEVLLRSLQTVHGGLQNTLIDAELLGFGRAITFLVRQALRDWIQRINVFSMVLAPNGPHRQRFKLFDRFMAMLTLHAKFYFMDVDTTTPPYVKFIRTDENTVTVPHLSQGDYGPPTLNNIWFRGPLAYTRQRRVHPSQPAIDAVMKVGKATHRNDVSFMSTIMSSIAQGSYEDFAPHKEKYREAAMKFVDDNHPEPKFVYDCITTALKYALYRSQHHVNHGILNPVNYGEGEQRPREVNWRRRLTRHIVHALLTMPFDDVQRHTTTLKAINFEEIMLYLTEVDIYTFALVKEGSFLGPLKRVGRARDPQKQRNEQIAKLMQNLIEHGRLDTIVLIHMATELEINHRISMYIKNNAHVMRNHLPAHLYWQIPYFNDYFEHTKINRLYFEGSRTDVKRRLRIADD